MLRRLIPVAVLAVAGVAMASPVMASTAAPAAPAHATAKAGPLTSGYCVVNGYGYYVTSNGPGAEMSGNATCTTDIAWRQQSNGSYLMAVNNGTSCLNMGSNGAAYDNSCVTNDSTEEVLPEEQSDGRYLLENVHYGTYLWTAGGGGPLLLTTANNATSQWSW